MPLLGERDVTRRRYSSGAYTAGVWSDGAATDTTIRASVQPLSGRDREVLEEGVRQRDGIKLYTTASGTLRTESQHDGTPADEVVIDTVVYTVVHVDVRHPLIGHDRAYALRAQEAA